VDALAYLLTGADININPNTPPLGSFYNTSKQQPGNFTVLGTTFPGTLSGLGSALQFLGTHPYTYMHLATKLVTHFVSDSPSQADIQTVANAFAATGGSLPAAHAAIVGLSSAWVPLQKIKTPHDFLISALRAANVTAQTMPANVDNSLTAMSQPTWRPPFPNGWSDFAADWTGAESMLMRGDWSNGFANQMAKGLTGVDPKTMALSCVAPLMSQRTISILEGLATTQQQYASIILSSEFQRR
jgi:uncharacterized protein (DUF1800 family)